MFTNPVGDYAERLTSVTLRAAMDGDIAKALSRIFNTANDPNNYKERCRWRHKGTAVSTLDDAVSELAFRDRRLVLSLWR